MTPSASDSHDAGNYPTRSGTPAFCKHSGRRLRTNPAGARDTIMTVRASRVRSAVKSVADHRFYLLARQYAAGCDSPGCAGRIELHVAPTPFAGSRRHTRMRRAGRVYLDPAGTFRHADLAQPSGFVSTAGELDRPDSSSSATATGAAGRPAPWNHPERTRVRRNARVVVNHPGKYRSDRFPVTSGGTDPHRRDAAGPADAAPRGPAERPARAAAPRAPDRHSAAARSA